MTAWGLASGGGPRAEVAPTRRHLEPNFRNILEPWVDACAFVIGRRKLNFLDVLTSM